MISNLPIDILKYLNKYQVKGWTVETTTNSKLKNIIVIPAIAEYGNTKILLNSLILNNPAYLKRSLILFVINNTRSASLETKEDNLKTIQLLRSIIHKQKSSDNFLNDAIDSSLNPGLIDASTEGKELPEREGGVGFARKLGMDLALTLFDYEDTGKNVLTCLDADCIVAPNYLEVITRSFDEHKLSAASIPFRHTIEGSEEQQLAICCYEIFLRYYVLALKYAGSAYAFHTVGSSMACDHNAYIKSEGMNKLKAAEDFYFLEKLAKNFKIASIEDTTVYPSSRSSWRVPFGTGQRVNRFLSHRQNEYLLYNPESFTVLKEWLNLFNSSDILSAGKYLEIAENIHPQLKDFLEQQNFSGSWESIIQHNKNEVQIQRQKTSWFNGFRTLKLIHHLRDNGFPMINMFDALDQMLKNFNSAEVHRNQNNPIPPLAIQLQYLESLRKLA